MRYTKGDPAAALRSVGGAVSLCSFTTIVGYGALLVADNQALQSFGRYAMAGEVACFQHERGGGGHSGNRQRSNSCRVRPHTHED
jgi:hypothetical protein